MIGALLTGGDLGWPAVGVVLRALWYAAGLAGSGLAFFALLHGARQEAADRARLRRRAASAAGVGLAAGAGWLAVQVLVLTDGVSALDAEAWGIVAESRSGLSVAVGAAGLLLVAPLAAPRAGTPLPALGGVLFAGSHGLVGHTTMPAVAPLPAVLVAFHVAVAAWWVGGLPPMAWAARREGARAAALVEGWARAAAVAVPAMAAAGLGLSAWLLGGVAPLLASAYGWTLVAKVGLVCAMLALAAHNRFRLTPALAAGDPGAGARLARSIRVEAAVALLVLWAVAELTAVSPPAPPHIVG